MRIPGMETHNSNQVAQCLGCGKDVMKYEQHTFHVKGRKIILTSLLSVEEGGQHDPVFMCMECLVGSLYK